MPMTIEELKAMVPVWKLPPKLPPHHQLRKVVDVLYNGEKSKLEFIPPFAQMFNRELNGIPVLERRSFPGKVVLQIGKGRPRTTGEPNPFRDSAVLALIDEDTGKFELHHDTIPFLLWDVDVVVILLGWNDDPFDMGRAVA